MQKERIPILDWYINPNKDDLYKENRLPLKFNYAVYSHRKSIGFTN